MKLVCFTFLSLATVLLPFISVKAQDPSFSQYKFNKLYFNPAYAGYNEEHHVSFAYRNLWPNVPGIPVAGPLANYQVSADFFIRYGQPKRSKMAFTGAVGVFCNQNFEGSAHLMTSSFGVTYAQHFPIIQNVNELPQLLFSVGLKGYATNARINWDKLIYSDQLDIDYGITGSSLAGRNGIGTRWGGDVDAGGLLSSYFKGKDDWYNEIGFAAAHIVSSSLALSGSNNGLIKTPLKLSGSYRTKIALVHRQFFTGVLLLYEQQGKFSEFNTGVDFYIRTSKNGTSTPLILSIGHRLSLNQIAEKKQNTKALIAGVGFEGKVKGVRSATYYIGFSADVPYTGLSGKTFGAYEISVGFNIAKRTQSAKTDCFSF
jgi:type IX secretion system PorP/SprF family membrane protein